MPNILIGSPRGSDRLVARVDRHVDWFDDPAEAEAFCDECGSRNQHGPCGDDITAAYRNLTRNLAAVVMAAAVAQGERERIDPVAVVKSAASSLTEEQRVAIVEAVEDGRCSECYGPDPHCQCWNDE